MWEYRKMQIERNQDGDRMNTIGKFGGFILPQWISGHHHQELSRHALAPTLPTT